MLKLINHIIKEDKTRHGRSLQVTQFTKDGDSSHPFKGWKESPHAVLGIGQWAMGVKETRDSDARSNPILSMPHAQFPMPTKSPVGDFGDELNQNCAHQIVSRKISCILNNSELSKIGDGERLSLSQCQTVPCLLDPQVFTTISDFRASILLLKTLFFGTLCTRVPCASLMMSKTRILGEAQGTRRCLSLGEGCPDLYPECVAPTRKNCWYQWLYCLCDFIFYSKFQAIAGITSKSDSGKFNYQYKLLEEKRRGKWGYKINTEKNSSKEIKEEWKLYRSIFGKHRYTSLELAMRSPSVPCCPAFFSGRLPYSSGTREGLPPGQHRGDRFTDYVEEACFG